MFASFSPQFNPQNRTVRPIFPKMPSKMVEWRKQVIAPFSRRKGRFLSKNHGGPFSMARMICRFVLFRQKWHSILLLISKIRFWVSPVSPASWDTKNAAFPLRFLYGRNRKSGVSPFFTFPRGASQSPSVGRSWPQWAGSNGSNRSPD